MLKINILTLFPNMFEGFLTESIIKRAIDEEKVKINIKNLRDYANNKHNQVDDTPYGGGAGMVLKCEPVFDAIEDLKKKNSRVILMTPQGEQFTEDKAKELSKEKDLILICGHYEGFDERIETIVDDEISIGDYVLTGGELPSMVITDAITRLIPGVIENESKENESFTDNLLDYPTYTKPREYRGMKVPDVLLSGDHKKINEWRKEEQIKKTKERRPDLINNRIRKTIGKYSLMDDLSKKQMININMDDAYNFKPKKSFDVNKVMLVEPSFISKIAKRNLQKKLNTLFKQVDIVLNDETDDEGGSYVLGEIDRMQELIITLYGKYLDSEYLTLLLFKLDALKNEVSLKEMEKIETINYNKKGRSR